MYTEQAKEFIINKHGENIERIGGSFPHATDNGIYDRSEKCGWTGGFYAGISHLCHDMTGENRFLCHADMITEKLEHIYRVEKVDLEHDIGMIFIPSARAAYMKQPNARWEKLLTDAADTLMQRYHPEGGYIQAWNVWNENYPENAHRMIIDCLLNLPLLFCASELTGDKKYYDVAYAHAKTAQRYLVRADHTTAHTFVFYENGQPKCQKTHQGHSDRSCWARGQSWAVYGFALAYRYTKDETLLKTATECADKFIRLSEPNLIPKWDFDFASRRGAPRDTSAAGIAACGMMEIFEHTSDGKYREYAERICDELYMRYSSRYRPEEEGMIREATGHLPVGDNINVSLIYGDYFFCELTARICGKSKGYW